MQKRPVHSDDDVAETLRQAGVLADVPPAPDGRAVHSDDDVAETLRQAGVSVGAVHRPTLKTEIPEPKEGDLPPASRKEVDRIKKTLTPLSSVTEGMPIIGVAPRAATAAIAAGTQPLTDMGMPGDTFGARFGKNEEVLRRAQQEYDAENPAWAVPANFVGGALAAGPFAATKVGQAALGMRGASLGGRAYQGAAGGATIGGLDALARGENPFAGTILGGAGGVAAPFVGEGFRRGVGAISESVWPRPGPLKDMNPINLKRLIGTLDSETPASIQAGRDRMGPTGFLSDLTPELTDKARGLSFGEGTSKAGVREPYRLRDEQQGIEMKKALDTHIGKPVDDVTWNKMTEEGRAKAVDPLYTQWRASSVPLTPELESLVPRLKKAGAFKRAEELSGISGEPIDTLTFSLAGAKPGPTAKSWQYVKQGLNRGIDAAYNASDNTLARELVKLKKDLTAQLHDSPGGKLLKEADELFSSHSNLIDQYAAGRDTLIGGRSGISKSELKEEFSTLTGPEKKARIQGMRNAIEEAMGEPGSADDKMLNKLLGPNNQDKIKLMIGDKPGEALVARMKQLKHLQTKDYEVRGNSQTTTNTAAREALQPPQPTPWDVNLTQPMTLLPPTVREGMRPTNVMAARREARYGDADNQLAAILTTPEGPGLDLLLKSLRSEAERRAWVSAGGQQGANALSGMLTVAPAATANRRISR